MVAAGFALGLLAAVEAPVSAAPLGQPVAPTPRPPTQRWRLFLPSGLARYPFGD